MDNTVQAANEKASPCLKYFNNVTGNFPSLRAAVRSMGLEPTFIDVKRKGYGFAPETIVIKITLSHDHIPEFYRHLMETHSDLNRIYAVARTQICYKPKKHLVFILDDDRNGCYWLNPKRYALHLDLATNEWSWGPGKPPQRWADL